MRWSYTADARITSAPVLWRDLCFFGAHEGYIYCLKVSDGAPQWRFLAAAYPRKIVVGGQLESSWPVYNVVVHQDRICASAGYHSELAGGILVWALEPQTGQVAWNKTISKEHFKLASKERKSMVVNRAVNGLLQSEGDSLKLPGLTFRPEETEEQIRIRLSTPQKK